MKTKLLRTKQIPFFKHVATLVILLTFLSCSSDDDNKDDDKDDNRSEIEYYLQVQSETNMVLEMDYIDGSGNVITVSGDDASIKLVDGNREWSKKVKFEPPFEAEMNVRMRNDSDTSVPYLLSIFRGEEFLVISTGRIDPNTSKQDLATAEITD